MTARRFTLKPQPDIRERDESENKTGLQFIDRVSADEGKTTSATPLSVSVTPVVTPAPVVTPTGEVKPNSLLNLTQK